LTLPLVASYLIAASAAVILLLGIIHLIYTFRGRKLYPRDDDLYARMNQVALVITRQTTMWRAWLGFNASHSFGLILFGLVYGYLALVHSAMLFNSPFLMSIGCVLLVGYAVLAKLYWFRVPFRGVVLAASLYLAALVVAHT
jgi:hypothetical protein